MSNGILLLNGSSLCARDKICIAVVAVSVKDLWVKFCVSRDANKSAGYVSRTTLPPDVDPAGQRQPLFRNNSICLCFLKV